MLFKRKSLSERGKSLKKESLSPRNEEEIKSLRKKLTWRMSIKPSDQQDMKGIGLLMAAFDQRYIKDKFMDGRESKDKYQKIQFFCILQFLVALIGTVLCLKSYKMEFEGDYSIRNWKLLTMNFGLSLLCGLFEIFKLRKELQMKQLSGEIGVNENLITSGLIQVFWRKMIVVFIHPYPFLIGSKFTTYNRKLKKEVYYHLNDILSILCLVRLVYLMKSVLNLTRWKSSRSYRICQMYGCEADSLFCLKSMIKRNPFVFNFSLLTISILIFGHAIRVCEAPLTRVDSSMDYHLLSESMWSVVVTMTTLGYGDIHPRTDSGKFVMFLCSLVGVVLVSLMVLAVKNKLDMTSIQTKAFTVINKVEIKNSIKNCAADIIGKASKVFLKVKKHSKIPIRNIFTLNSRIKKFKKLRM